MYKKMNAKLEEIKRKRKEAALEKSVTDTENTKVQEYEYVDEDEMGEYPKCIRIRFVTIYHGKHNM